MCTILILKSCHKRFCSLPKVSAATYVCDSILKAGYYDVLFKHDGYDDIRITGLIVSPQNKTAQNIAMKPLANKNLSLKNVDHYPMSYLENIITGNIEIDSLSFPHQKIEDMLESAMPRIKKCKSR